MRYRSGAVVVGLVAATILGFGAQPAQAACEPDKVATKYPGLAGKTLKVGLDPTLPPVMYRDPKDPSKIVGQDPDMVDAAMKCLGLKYELVGLDFGTLIPTLQAGLMHPTTAEVVAMREEARIDSHAASVGVRVDARHPAADALGIEDVVPGGVERVSRIDAAAVPADLDHLRPAPQSQVWRRWMRCAADDAPEVHRACLLWVMRIADIELLELAGSPARHVQPAIVDRQVDVRHKRRNRAKGLKRRREF